MIALLFACLVNTEPNRKTALRRADLGLVEGVPSEKRVTILQADRVEKLFPQLTSAGARDYDPRQGPIEQAPQSGGNKNRGCFTRSVAGRQCRGMSRLDVRQGFALPLVGADSERTPA